MLLARVNYEHGAGELLHILYAGKVLFQLFLLGLELNDFLLGEIRKVAVRFHLLDLAELCYTGLDSLEVGEHAAQPALVYIEHLAALSFLLNGFLSLLLGADKQNAVARLSNAADEVIGFLSLLNGLLKVDDVDAVALGEDVFLHLGVPTAGLMTKVYACFKKLFHGNN